jgi:hypothetical protein
MVRSHFEHAKRATTLARHRDLGRRDVYGSRRWPQRDRLRAFGLDGLPAACREQQCITEKRSPYASAMLRLPRAQFVIAKLAGVASGQNGRVRRD